MNTHILISIEEIDATVNIIKGEILRYTEMGNEPKHLVMRYANESCLKLYETMKRTSKQISLDEKNTIDVLKISLDAVAEAMITMDKMNNPMDKTEKLFWTAGHTTGYKQALKDLL